MSNEKDVVESLVASVESLGESMFTLPIVEFRNETPSGWDAVIVAFGAAFFYKDPSNEKPVGDEQQQRPGPIYSGGSSYVQGTKNECCGRVVGAMTVRMDGRTETFQGAGNARPGYCLTRMPFVLKEKQLLSAADLASGKLPVELVVLD